MMIGFKFGLPPVLYFPSKGTFSGSYFQEVCKSLSKDWFKTEIDIKYKTFVYDDRVQKVNFKYVLHHNVKGYTDSFCIWKQNNSS